MNHGLQNSLVIIIPALNEAGRISSTITGIRKFSDADIIVVNDGSADNTSGEASAAGAASSFNIFDFTF